MAPRRGRQLLPISPEGRKSAPAAAQHGHRPRRLRSLVGQRSGRRPQRVGDISERRCGWQNLQPYVLANPIRWARGLCSSAAWPASTAGSRCRWAKQRCSRDLWQGAFGRSASRTSSSPLRPWKPQPPTTPGCKTNLTSCCASERSMQAAEGLIGGTNKQERSKACLRWMEHALSGAAANGIREQLVTELFCPAGVPRRQAPPRHRTFAELAPLRPSTFAQACVAQGHVERGLGAGSPSRLAMSGRRARAGVFGRMLAAGLGEERLATARRRDQVPGGRLGAHHPDEAHQTHVRAWMPDAPGAMQCHMDVEAGDGRSLLLQ